MESIRRGLVLSRVRGEDGVWSGWTRRELVLRPADALLVIRGSPEVELRVVSVERHHYAPPSVRQLVVECEGTGLELRWGRETPSFIRDEFSEWERDLQLAAENRARRLRGLREEWLGVQRRLFASQGLALPENLPLGRSPVPPLNVLLLVVGTRGECSHPVISRQDRQATWPR